MTESSLFGFTRQSFLYESNLRIDCRYNHWIYDNTAHRAIQCDSDNSSYCYYFLFNIIYTCKAYCTEYPKDSKKKVSYKWYIPIHFPIDDVHDHHIYWITPVHGTLKYCFFIDTIHCFGIMLRQESPMSYLIEMTKFQLRRKTSDLQSLANYD